MKARIDITGSGINSKFTLKRHLGTRCTEAKDRMFNNYVLYYDSIGDAKRDIQEAHRELKERGSEKAKDNSFISYDAGSATVSRLEN